MTWNTRCKPVALLLHLPVQCCHAICGTPATRWWKFVFMHTVGTVPILQGGCQGFDSPTEKISQVPAQGDTCIWVVLWLLVLYYICVLCGSFLQIHLLPVIAHKIDVFYYEYNVLINHVQVHCTIPFLVIMEFIWNFAWALSKFSFAWTWYKTLHVRVFMMDNREH